ncbi:phosphatidylserine/phosphatidylglycerophosphate/cardiolipin synthase family protein [Sphingomonas sp. 2R-10]|uniref:phospholipase D-like domain-containing protein n=1 Tax=Sphingomonas sp. 2R-10 TaxID=3045148 RepID=UPI000F7A9585|nr:phosphatidylserine/phosphatidylglycerophosphate/cardiolipin synthase family protein [Sphingomonas sp. 2R-10]MDJ0275536.1 phosphatidylserine/phosphatidylglycerophosphate/cardiolipin synthase family protein [Sphingomonas sp. 2R-10]
MADHPQPTFAVAGNQLTLLTEGPARLDALLALIAGARRSLRFLFYIWEEDRAGTQVRDALIAAARRGIRVSLIVDGLGAEAAASRGFFGPLREAGGEVCVFVPRIGRRYLLRNHQKLALADEARVIVGGFNIEDAYFGTVAEQAWRDLGLLVDGPAAGRLAGYFDALKAWTALPGAPLRRLSRLLREWSEERGPIRWLLGGPSQRLSPWARTLKHEIRHSNRIDMIAAYFAPGPLMTRRLDQAAKRTRLRIVVPAKTDHAIALLAARFTYRNLLRHRVELYEYRPTKLHTKLFVTDDAVHIGSANFDVRSMFLNMELMLRVEDAAFAAHLRAYMDGEIAQSQRVTRELHRERSGWWARVKQAGAYFVMSVLDPEVTVWLNRD